MKTQANTTLFFYQNSRIFNVGPVTIFRADDQPLAEQHAGDASTPGLLATDDKGSVLTVQNDEEDEGLAYSAYGHDPNFLSRKTLLGFNGECIEPLTESYPLGSGYRIYAPHLMRFLSADNLSPFGKGGLNPYAYCMSDPINHIDPSGHIFGKIARLFGIKSAKPTSRKTSFEEESAKPASRRSSFEKAFDKITPPPKYTLLPTKGQETQNLSMGKLDTSSPITELEYNVLDNLAARHRDSKYSQITDLLEQTKQPDQQELYKLLYAADEATMLRASILMRKELYNGFAANQSHQTSIRRT